MVGSYSVDGLAVVLSDVDSNESTSSDAREERRVTPSKKKSVSMEGEASYHGSYFSIRKRVNIMDFSCDFVLIAVDLLRFDSSCCAALL